MTANSRDRKSNVQRALPVPIFAGAQRGLQIRFESVGAFDWSNSIFSIRHATCVFTRRNQAMPTWVRPPYDTRRRLADRDRLAQVVVVELGEHAALDERLQLPVDPRPEQRRVAVAEDGARIDGGQASAQHQLLAAPEQVAVHEQQTERLVVRRPRAGRHRRPRELVLDRDVDAHAGALRLPPDVHVGEQAGRVEPVAHGVQRVDVHRVADGDAGDRTHGRLLRAHVAHHADIGDLLTDRERRPFKHRQRQIP